MLTLIIGLLTFILVFICAILMVLILAQLPKKDAGAGLAFGAGTAEAIFGAGAGTPLAQITKYCAGLFLGLALTLSALNAYRSNQNIQRIEDEAARKDAAEKVEKSIEGSSETQIERSQNDASENEDSEIQDMNENAIEDSENEDSEIQDSENDASETPQMFEGSDSLLENEPLEQRKPTPPTLPNPNN